MKPRRFTLLRIVLMLPISAAGILTFFHLRSTSFLTTTNEKIAAAEQQARARGVALLEELQAGPQKDRLVSAAISAKAVNELLALLDDATYNDEKSGLSLHISHAATRFSTGFPRLTVETELGHPVIGANKVKVKAALALILDTAATDAGDSVMLRPVFVDFESGSLVPAALKTTVNAEAVRRINETLPLLPLPVPREFKIEASPADTATLVKALSKIEAPLPSGKAIITATLPPLPSATLRLHPVLLLATEEALHVIASVNAVNLAEPKNPAPASQEDLKKLLESFSLGKDEDIALTVPSGPVNDALGEFNQRPAAQRTVNFTITGQGHIQDKTGGAPFGNGFQSWFEGQPSGKAELSKLRITWGQDQLDAALTVNVSGKAQVHVHGNAPKPLGFKIGGGAGTSVGVPFGTRGNVDLKGTVLAQNNQFEASLVAGNIPARATITGIVNIPVDVNAPLPRDLKVKFALPSLVSPKPIVIPELKGLTTSVKQVTVEAQNPSLKIKPDGLRASAAVKISKQVGTTNR